MAFLDARRGWRPSRRASRSSLPRLRDNKAATVVGADVDRTFGKGVIQTVLPLGDPPGVDGGVAVTVARYRTPSGADINGVGIAPDKRVACSVADKAAVCAGRG